MSISLIVSPGSGQVSWASLAGGLGVCGVWVSSPFANRRDSMRHQADWPQDQSHARRKTLTARGVSQCVRGDCNPCPMGPTWCGTMLNMIPTLVSWRHAPNAILHMPCQPCQGTWAKGDDALILAVANTKGGVGKTTLSFLISV